MKWPIQTTEREKSLSSAQEPLSVLQNLGDFETEAQKILPEKSWIYYSSATDTSSSHINNRAAFNKVYLRPRVLRNVARVSLQRTIMGFRSSLPIFIAPAALAKLGHPEGELCLTRGAARYNIPHCPSTYSSIGHATLVDCLKAEQDAAGAERGTLFFQLYTPINKREGALKLIAEAKRLHFSALVVTVDSAVIGKREDDERYKARLDQESGIVFQANSSPDPDPTVDRPVPRGAHSSTLEWDDLVWIREAWGSTKPIILKGIATVEDVAEAATRGIDGVYLSNHGGRQLDYAPSSLHTLMEIRLYQPQLFDKIEIYVDGGFRRGTDVIKALCLGARAVGLGRPFMYSLTGYGTDGVCRAIESKYPSLGLCVRVLTPLQCSATRSKRPCVSWVSRVLTSWI